MGHSTFCPTSHRTTLIALLPKYRPRLSMRARDGRNRSSSKRKHAETRISSVREQQRSRRDLRADLRARAGSRQRRRGEMACFKRSKSFHGMRPRRLSGYLRVSLVGPASGEQLEGKKKWEEGEEGRNARADEESLLPRCWLEPRIPVGPGALATVILKISPTDRQGSASLRGL